jgi:hypothetical protein
MVLHAECTGKCILHMTQRAEIEKAAREKETALAA